ncbi:protoheme IX farnesyltransferase [Aureimonas leprariae]|uniref:Protoheme IX farnesyltransferase n=1 Tax=Plantimonas leprariae TaxID=2615207 RepID=A0A7V7PNY9_9HYPH|nr:protoheme IX farnesyltransferase [Aureimonas leprariae]KAB0679582.1 protoheme IX farnesyltransferase [Aureimonas leprariae]
MQDDRITLTPEEQAARRRRSVAIGVFLVALVVIFYVVTLAKIGG